MNFQNSSILFVPGERPYSEVTNPRVYNSNNIIVFSDSIASFTWNIRSNFDNQLKEGRARFKYFPETKNWRMSIWHSNNSYLIFLFLNDLLNNTAGTEVLLQNILKIAARCKMYCINKIFVSSVLNTHKVSSDLIAKLNLDISSICKSNRFHFRAC